jgi:hypothetical protein
MSPKEDLHYFMNMMWFSASKLIDEKRMIILCSKNALPMEKPVLLADFIFY